MSQTWNSLHSRYLKILFCVELDVRVARTIVFARPAWRKVREEANGVVSLRHRRLPRPGVRELRAQSRFLETKGRQLKVLGLGLGCLVDAFSWMRSVDVSFAER